MRLIPIPDFAPEVARRAEVRFGEGMTPAKHQWVVLVETHWFAGAEVTVEGEWLVLWRHSGASRDEWLRLNLAVALSSSAGNPREQPSHTASSRVPTHPTT
jgi:hypothetical protein